jgi:flagellar protein FliO/FliZ
VSTGAALGLRVSLALGLVLGLLWVAARLMRGRTGGRAGHAVEVLARAPLGRGASVTVLRVGEQALVLGVTEHGINQLGPRITDLTQLQQKRETVSPVPTEVSVPAPRAAGRRTPEQSPLAGSLLSPATWQKTVDALRERTVRRG